MPALSNRIELIKERQKALKIQRENELQEIDKLIKGKPKRRNSRRLSAADPDEEKSTRSYIIPGVSATINGRGKKDDPYTPKRHRYSNRTSYNPETLYALQAEHSETLGNYVVRQCQCNRYFFSNGYRSCQRCDKKHERDSQNFRVRGARVTERLGDLDSI